MNQKERGQRIVFSPSGKIMNGPKRRAISLSKQNKMQTDDQGPKDKKESVRGLDRTNKIGTRVHDLASSVIESHFLDRCFHIEGELGSFLT